MNITINTEDEQLELSIDYDNENSFNLEFGNKKHIVRLEDLNIDFLFELRTKVDEIIKEGAYPEKCKGCPHWVDKEGCMSLIECHKNKGSISNDYYKEEYEKYYKQIGGCNQIFGWMRATLNFKTPVNWKVDYVRVYDKLKKALEVKEEDVIEDE